MRPTQQNEMLPEMKEVPNRTALDTLPLLICLFDRQKNFVDFYKGSFLAKQKGKYDIDAFMGTNISDYLQDTTTGYHRAFALLNDAFDRLLASDMVQHFKYEVDGYYYESTLIIADDNYVTSYVRRVAQPNPETLNELGFLSRKERELAEANRRLKEIVRQNEMIMNNASSGFVFLNPDYQVVWENVSVVFSQYASKGLYKKGHCCYESFGRNESCTSCVTRRVLESRKPCRSEFSGIEGVVAEVFGNPIFNQQGEIEGVILRIDDITERKESIRRIEESEQKLAEANQLLLAILNCMPCSFFIKDADNDFRYVMANQRFHKQLKTQVTDFVGMTDFDLFDQKQAQEYRLNDEEVLRVGQTLDLREETIDAKGVQQIWHSTKTPLRLTEGNRNLLIGVALDITDDVRKQEELERAKKRAEQSDALKSAFLANMSHEIRTPLNAIVGFARLIHTVDDDERDTYLDIIDNNSELLLKLIGDILDLSKIEAGYVEYSNSRFDLVALFSELEMIFQHKVQPGVSLINKKQFDQCFVVLDRSRVSQLLSNFLTNAIKFTSQGTIEMGYEVGEKRIRIYVKDTGCGISEENQSKVFDRFEKFDKFTQGSGLGMSICKAITDAYGGEIGVSSIPDQGSEFWVWLPSEIDINEEKPVTVPNLFPKGEIRKGTDKSMIKVLLAEDNDSNFILIKTILKGYNLTRVFNGADAVESMRAEYFDLVLMDIRMPVMDGLKATQMIRQFNKHVPIFALTANAFESDRKAAIDAGCNDFLTKPIDKNKLLKILEDIVVYNNVQLYT